MWKYQKSLQNGFASIRFYKFLSGLFLSLVLVGCASTTQRLQQPSLHLVDPMTFLKGTPDSDYQKAYLEYSRGNLQKARTGFQKVIRNAPDHYPAYLAIAYTYLAEKDADTAEKYIRKSLELSPEYPQAHYALGYILEMRHEYDAALVELDEVSRLNPDYPGIQQDGNIMKLKSTEQHLAQAQELSENNPEAAIQHLKRAQELAPEVSQIPLDIAKILIRQGNCAEALPYLQSADERNPGTPEIKKQLASCLLDLQQYNEALLVLQNLAILEPEDTQTKQQIEKIKKLIFVNTLPEEFQAISTAEQINRGQMAALLLVHLEILQSYRTQESQIIVDSIDHWAQNFIRKVVNLGIFDLFPNRTFQPSRPVTRLELAKAVSRILEILGRNMNNGMKAEGTGEPVTIPDIGPASVYYSMVIKALSAGVMSLDADGRFHPGRPVSGAEALSVVNRLKSLVE